MLAAAADNAPGGGVTVTASAEVVVSSIRRLSHHRMMSGNVFDGLELVRRPYNGRGITRSPTFEPLGSTVVHSSKSCSQLVFEPYERVGSSRRTTSTPGVVIAIESRTQNDAKGPKHARVHS